MSEPAPVVFTNKARCRDCYKCLRHCPVKAIRLEDGQASVVPDRCIACGTCIRDCPQEAKQARNDLHRAKEIAAKDEPMIASIAPSFAAFYSDWERSRIPSALRRLGFYRVEETAIGAGPVAAASTAQQREEPSICTACPAVVNYVNLYEQHLKEAMVPVVSPMQAHGRMIKEKTPTAKVVFIGPCIAKKKEADDTKNNQVDCVITFDDLEEWLEQEEIKLAECEESEFDASPTKDARLFPVPGGLAKTSGLHGDVDTNDVVAVSGITEVREALESLPFLKGSLLVEPLFCTQGCISGPGAPNDKPLFVRKRRLLQYAKQATGCKEMVHVSDEIINGGATQPPLEEHSFSKSEIETLLVETGKESVEARLNCGACGYPTCEEKAVAVLSGMAEKEMCLPQMRRLAEQRTDMIIDTVPSGIVLLDLNLNILHMNPAFRRFFSCSESVAGRPVSYLIDPHPFESLAAGETELVNGVHNYDNYNLVVQLIAYQLTGANQFVGIFVNLTESLLTEQKLEHMRIETVRQAEELLAHQMKVAQEMSRFLGESTAKGEVLVQNLLRTGSDTGQSKNKEQDKNWLWNILTSK